MHLTTPTGSYWITDQQPKKILRALNTKPRPEKLQTLLSFSLPVCLLAVMTAAFLVMGLRIRDNKDLLDESSFGRFIGTTVLIAVVAMLVWNAYSYWVAKDDRQDEIRQQAYRGYIPGVHSSWSLVYRAIGIDKLSDDFLAAQENSLNEFFRRYNRTNMPQSHASGVEDAITSHRRTLKILNDAEEMLRTIGADESHIAELREEAQRAFLSVRSDYTRLRDSAQESINMIDTQLANQ